MIKKFLLFFILANSFYFFSQQRVLPFEGTAPIPFVNFEARSPESGQEVAFSIQLLLFLTIITLSPSILMLTTGFLRIAIVLDFVKRALGLQQVPPNQLLMGIALFATVFAMWPTFNQIYTEAFVPLSANEIDFATFYSRAEAPLRIFMYRQMANSNHREIQLFMELGGYGRPQTVADVPTQVLIPSFVLHELTIAFKIGILIFIPFIIIDMVVSSVLMSMGMIMLPPVMISLPFKLILFVLIDGWSLIIEQLIKSFG